MQRLARESRLPRLELDISDNNIPHAVESIADWIEATGRRVDGMGRNQHNGCIGLQRFSKRKTFHHNPMKKPRQVVTDW
jgi:hypothetical protein